MVTLKKKILLETTFISVRAESSLEGFVIQGVKMKYPSPDSLFLSAEPPLPFLRPYTPTHIYTLFIFIFVCV